MGSLIISAAKPSGAKAILDRDGDWYRIILGGFNIFNSSGEYYTFEGIEELFKDEQRVLCRRLKSGQLRGEINHPKNLTGTVMEKIARVMSIDMTLVSHFIKEIELKHTNENSGFRNTPYSNNTIVNVIGWVLPSGPYAETLKRDLDNPEINVAFSLRALTSIAVVGGINIKKVTDISTYDYVFEPGISRANKFTTAGFATENMSLITEEVVDTFTYEELLTARKDILRIKACGGNLCSCSFESASVEHVVDTALKILAPSAYKTIINIGK